MIGISIMLLAMSSNAKADCPGCGLMIIVVPLELVIVDGLSTLAVDTGGTLLGAEGRLGPTFVGGLWGGLAGFLLGSLVAYPYFDEVPSALGIGGAVVGLPAGVNVGTLAGFFLDARSANRTSESHLLQPFHFTFFPRPGSFTLHVVRSF